MTKNMPNLLSVAAAKASLIARFDAVDTETIALRQALGRVLGRDLLAQLAMPPFDNSSMDGFALRAADVVTATPAQPVQLQVLADIPAGTVPEIHLAAGQAAQIVTGAMLPSGADAVIPVEQTNLAQLTPGATLASTVSVLQAVQPGDYVRRRGEDIQINACLLRAGQRLRPQDVGVAAMQGLPAVQVFRRPRVGLFSTGDELLQAGEPIVPGKIYEANSYTLGAQIQQAGCELIDFGTCSDNLEAVRTLFQIAATAQLDLIVSSAGVSMGAYDFVRLVLEQDGKLAFWRVNMRPGKPLTFGDYQGIPFIGLPGNPVSAFVGFEVFVRPALMKLAGETAVERPEIRVRLAEALESDGRESYLRAVIAPDDAGSLTARLTGHQGSGHLQSLVQANALLIIPSGVISLPAGAEVTAWYL